jgi:hypothetical protein
MIEKKQEKAKGQRTLQAEYEIVYDSNPTQKEIEDWDRLWRYLLFDEPLVVSNVITQNRHRERTVSKPSSNITSSFYAPTVVNV